MCEHVGTLTDPSVWTNQSTAIQECTEKQFSLAYLAKNVLEWDACLKHKALKMLWSTLCINYTFFSSINTSLSGSAKDNYFGKNNKMRWTHLRTRMRFNLRYVSKNISQSMWAGKKKKKRNECHILSEHDTHWKHSERGCVLQKQSSNKRMSACCVSVVILSIKRGWEFKHRDEGEDSVQQGAGIRHQQLLPIHGQRRDEDLRGRETAPANDGSR